MIRTIATLSLLTATSLFAQNRVHINGLPTNLSADWSNVIVAADALQPNAFLALMPLSEVAGFGSGFALIDDDTSMDFSFGAGNWLRCTMTATDYAYITDAMCAHQPGPGFAAPQALLTTSYDFGVYSPVAGMPFQPFPNSTRFGGNSVSYINGVGLPPFVREAWQLRTRGFWPNEIWNGCGQNPNVIANFDGFLLARFTFSFQ